MKRSELWFPTVDDLSVQQLSSVMEIVRGKPHDGGGEMPDRQTRRIWARGPRRRSLEGGAR